jgi:tetratricopeptide (TPR) repeat protein
VRIAVVLSVGATLALLAGAAGAAAKGKAKGKGKKKDPPAATAEPTPDAAATAAETSAPAAGTAAAAAPLPKTAKEWFDRGTVAHKLGDYKEAAAAYKEAYRLAPHPTILYNLAVVHRLMGEHAEALRLYKLFVKEDTGTALRAEAEARVAELTEVVRKAEEAKMRPPTEPAAVGTGSSATTAPTPASLMALPGADAAPESKGKSGAVLGIAIGGAVAVLAAGAVAAILLLTAKDPVDRTIVDYPGVVFDKRAK